VKESLRKSGIDIIGDVPWGTHICQFYQTKEDFMDILVPYFKTGLENNEFSMWITSGPLEVEDAKESLRMTVPDIDSYLEKGQIQIIPYSRFYAEEDVFDSERILNNLVEKLNQALASGYDGLRLSGNALWLENKDWSDFVNYEIKLDSAIGNYKMIALCTYSLDRFDATKIIEAAINHQFVLIKREGKLEQIKNSRREKEEERIQSLADIVESSNDAILTISLGGTIISWNKGAEQTYGYSAKEIIGKPISILEPPILVEETEELIEMFKQGDKIHNYETLRLREDARIINVSVTFSPIFDASKNLISISVISRDITRSKRVEEKLRKSEERYRIATEQTGQVVYEYDLRTDKSGWAGAIEEVTGYSLEEFQRFGKEVWLKNIHLTDMSSGNEKFQSARKTGGRFKEELRLRKKDGSCIYIENNGVWLKGYDGQPCEAIGVLKDITERKKTENFLKSIETVRKKEIHHRIKNNLQVISSLLDLQADKFNDTKVVEAFRESQNRVVSMALIHEELHEGGESEVLNSSIYLERLVENIFQTYRSRNADIRLNMDLEENIFFDMDTVVPLGLIVNELVSNSLKHAFVDRDNGQIQIKLCKEVSGGYKDNIAGSKQEESQGTSFILIVSDNGIGIPGDFDLENPVSLGMQLVNTLIDQLEGKLELKKDNGTEFTIKFRVM